MKSLTLATLLLPTLLLGCSERTQPASYAELAAQAAAASSAPQLPQTLELVIDGKPITMEVDKPRDGHVSVNSLVGNVLTISAMDKANDISLVLSATPADGKALGPGTFQSFKCLEYDDCTDAERAFDEQHTEAMLMKFPGKQYVRGDHLSAHKSRALNLQPATITISSVQDAYWNGVGPTKRVKGTFSGTLADVENDKEGRKVLAGPVKKVEGSFDVYTGRVLQP